MQWEFSIWIPIIYEFYRQNAYLQKYESKRHRKSEHKYGAPSLHRNVMANVDGKKPRIAIKKTAGPIIKKPYHTYSECNVVAQGSLRMTFSRGNKMNKQFDARKIIANFRVNMHRD